MVERSKRTGKAAFRLMKLAGLSFAGGLVGFGLGFLILAAGSWAIDYVTAGVTVTSVGGLFSASLVFLVHRHQGRPLVLALGAGIGFVLGSLASLFGPILILPGIGYLVFALLPAIASALGGLVSGALVLAFEEAAMRP